MAELPIPVIIYRLRPEEAYKMGIWADTIDDIGQLLNSPPKPTSSTLALPIFAALSTEEGLAHSAETKSLWLLHPQLQELQVYRGNPSLLALKQSTAFYEAYLSHNSSAIPYKWYSEAELKLRQQEEHFVTDDAPNFWLENPEKQSFLGVLGNYFFGWQESGHKILSASSHAELPNKAKEATEFLKQEFHKGVFNSQNTDGAITMAQADENVPEQIPLSITRQASTASLVSLMLQSKWPKKNKNGEKQQSSEAINPAEAWLLEAQASLEKLHKTFCNSAPKPRKATKAVADIAMDSDIPQNLKTPSVSKTPSAPKTPNTAREQQSIHLAQTLWALLAFWISAKLNPSVVLRKLTAWLDREKTHARLQEQLQERVLQEQLEEKLREQAQAEQAQGPQGKQIQEQFQAEQFQAEQSQAEQAQANLCKEERTEEKWLDQEIDSDRET